MRNKNDAELIREPKVFTEKMQGGKIKWQKIRKKNTHLTQKKKKRK